MQNQQTTLTTDQQPIDDLIEDDDPEAEPDASDIPSGGTVKINDLYRVLYLELKRVNRCNSERKFLLPEFEREELAITRQMIQRALTAPGVRSRPTSRTFVI